VALKSIWNGTIAFGGVYVPVKVHSATEDRTVHFHEVHLDDGARIEHKRFCSKEDEEVPYRKRLRQVVNKKRKGQTIEIDSADDKPPDAVPDLMAALEESLAEARKGRSGGRSKAKSSR
jgi:non-homologous end joining protein Ku